MSKQTTKQASADKTVFAGTIEGKSVIVKHVLRRRYAVVVGGKDAGYITSKDPLNAGGRVATVAKLADLKAILH
jgi:hypothetical protein